MLLNIKLKSFIITAGIIYLSGCAAINYGKVVDESIVTIERQRSRIADVGQVTIYQQKEGYLVKGKVTRNSYVRGHILGHLDFELLNPKGEVTFKATTGYRHSGIRFSSEDFSLKIDKPINKGSLLRITHVEYASHKN